jgi:hypothetical protein
MGKVIALLLVILCISLIAQELNELSIVGKAVKINDIVSSSIKDVNNRKASCIIFLTDLDVDMDFKPNIELVKLISKAGRHEVYVQPGERVIEVLASGFKPLNVVLSSFGVSKLESGNVYQLEITGEKNSNLIPVNFIIEPKNSEVFVDGDYKGIITNIQISTGLHTFKIVKDNYQTIEREENISISNSLLQFELTEQMDIPVTIKTTPSGARIFLDDIKTTVTPTPFFYPDGIYTIRIEKENYETIEESITISSPQINKNYILEDIRATLTIKTYSSATVYINGNSYKGGVSGLIFSPQIVKVRVEMPKAVTINRSIILNKKEIITEEIYPKIETGKVTINTIPIDAEITLQDDSGAQYNSNHPTTFKDIPVGIYVLSIKAKNYQSHNEHINVVADSIVSKEVILVEGTDKSSFSKFNIISNNKTGFNRNSKISLKEINSLNGENKLSIDPNPLPNNTNANIDFSFKNINTSPNNISLNIYNIRGQLVYTTTISKDIVNLIEPNKSYNISYKWNGYDSKGSQLIDGVYFVKFLFDINIDNAIQKMIKL